NLSQSNWLVVSNHGPTDLNEQGIVERIAFTAPTDPDFGRYAAWKVLPGIYRVDWSECHSEGRYILLPGWPTFVFFAIAPIIAIRGVGQRIRRDRRQRGYCPTCG